MAHGKAAARDKVWGRRGGRWAEQGSGRRLDELHRARLAGIRAGTWPEASIVLWRALAEAVHARGGEPVTSTERRALEVEAAARKVAA